MTYENKYTCPDCGHEWTDLWDCGCDDDCPVCGCRHISPTDSVPLTPSVRDFEDEE